VRDRRRTRRRSTCRLFPIAITFDIDHEIVPEYMTGIQ
jgi:hypothetical protein